MVFDAASMVSVMMVLPGLCLHSFVFLPVAMAFVHEHTSEMSTHFLRSGRRQLNQVVVESTRVEEKSPIDTLLCDLGTPLRSPSHDVLKTVDFQFWYAVGTNGTPSTTTASTANNADSLDKPTLFKIEQALQTSIKQDVLWCSEIKDDEIESTDEAQSGSSDRTRHLGIVTYFSGDLDDVTNFVCPSNDSLNYLMANTDANRCLVIRGDMRIIAHAVDDLPFAIAGLRNGLQEAMRRGIGQNGEVSSHVKFLTYLGDSQEQALGIPLGEQIRENQSGGSMAGVSDTTKDEDSEPIGLVFGICLLIFAATVLSAVYYAKHKYTEAAVPSMPKRRRPLVGTGDHPDSFHEGLYHHTCRGGREYLSTRCTKCELTRSLGFQYHESFDEEMRNGMVTIIEECSSEYSTDAPSYSDNFILDQASSKEGLGQKHMGHDVHCCRSSLCDGCGDSTATTFLPTPALSGHTASYLKAVALSNRRQGSSASYRRSDLAALSATLRSRSSGTKTFIDLLESRSQSTNLHDSTMYCISCSSSESQ